MLNRRGFFKAAAAVGAVTAVTASTEAATEAEVVPPRIPDGPVVGIGFRPLLEALTDPELAARVVTIYASYTDQQSLHMHFMQQDTDNWRVKLDEAKHKIDELKAAGKLSDYADWNDLDMRYDDSWPDEANGEWQAFPFVTIAEQRLIDEAAV